MLINVFCSQVEEEEPEEEQAEEEEGVEEQEEEGDKEERIKEEEKEVDQVSVFLIIIIKVKLSSWSSLVVHLSFGFIISKKYFLCVLLPRLPKGRRSCEGS